MDRPIRTKQGARDQGFTIVELMMVVLVIGILVVIAIPTFVTVTASAKKKTCFASQRSIEGVVSVWQAETRSDTTEPLEGVVTAGHPLIAGHFLLRPPRCPVAPTPSDVANPSASEGAYTLNASATVQACSFGSLGAHGSFH